MPTYVVAISLAVVPLTAFVFGAHRMLSREVTQRLVTQSSRSGKLLAALVERPLLDNATFLEAFAERPSVLQYWREQQTTELAAALTRIRELRSTFAAVGVYDSNGTLRAVSPEGSAPLVRQAQFVAAYAGVQAGNSRYVSPVYQSAQGAGYALAIAVPLRDEHGSLLGIVVAEQSLESATHEIYAYATPESTALYFVVDQDGQIFGKQGSRFAVVSGNREILQRLSKAPPDTGEHLHLGAEDVIAAYSPIPSLGWGLLISVPVSTLMQSLWKLERIFAFFGGFVLLLAIGGGGTVAAIYRRFRAREQEYQKQIEEQNRELSSSTASLKAANKELEAFTYSVAHDLRSPLRHISGFAKLLESDVGDRLSASGRRYLDMVCASARQMGLLIDQLLDLSRLERRELSISITGLNSIVDDVVTHLAQEQSGRKIDWKIGRLPFVECDAVLMRQLFINLLSNAVKYTRHKDPAVIEIGLLEPTPDGPTIFVRDNGVGFSMKHADQLFGVFQRLHRQEDFEGTGVGLATVQRIIHKHGGQVWAEAELERGATFYFTLANSVGAAGAQAGAA